MNDPTLAIQGAPYVVDVPGATLAVLDTTAPGAPTVLHISSSANVGQNRNLTLAWTAPTGVTDLGGYRLWRD